MELLLKPLFKFDIPRTYNGFRSAQISSCESVAYLGTSNGAIEVVDLVESRSKGAISVPAFPSREPVLTLA